MDNWRGARASGSCGRKIHEDSILGQSWSLLSTGIYAKKYRNGNCA